MNGNYLSRLSGRIAMLAAACAVGLAAAAQQSQTGWVHLNNGSIVTGTVSVSGSTVSIVTERGDVLNYPMVEVNRISYQAPPTPRVGVDRDLTDYTTNDTGFWGAVQGFGASTLFIDARCTQLAELDLVGGYRFSQYLKVGLGLGARYYFNNTRLRDSSIEWAMPLFATVRGNFIHEGYRNVVPYYSIDVGGAVRDGFMWRPAVGIRVGQPRNAFTLALTYMGQNLTYKDGKDKYVSALGLTVGYEF